MRAVFVEQVESQCVNTRALIRQRFCLRIMMLPQKKTRSNLKYSLSNDG